MGLKTFSQSVTENDTTFDSFNIPLFSDSLEFKAFWQSDSTLDSLVVIPPNEDSLICLQKSILINAMLDIKRGDLNKQRVELLKTDTFNLKQIIHFKDSTIITQRNQIIRLQGALDDCKVSLEICELNVQKLNRTIHKMKNKLVLWRVVSIGLAGGIAGAYIFSK